MTNLQRHEAEWALPPLSAEEERLIDAYVRTGRSVDDLPYTDEFEQLCQDLGIDETRTARHEVFRKLANLRKQGRLPRSNVRPFLAARRTKR